MLTLSCVVLLQLFVFARGGFAAEAVDIGSRLELFVDHYLVGELDGAELRLHHPVRSGVALAFDRPWEGIVSGYVTVMYDRGKYRMYYRGRPMTTAADATEQAHEVACYAESVDGITFTRPHLGFYEVAGTRDNNVILTQPKTVTHNFAPFRDTRPGVPADERYKAVGGTGKAGLIPFVSADGIRWKQLQEGPIITKGAFDSQNNVFWSKHEGKYICFFRTWKHGVRWITRTTSDDFLHWQEPTDMEFGDAPNEHLYTNQTEPYYRAPHIYIGTAARFVPGRWALTPEQEKAIDLHGPQNYSALGGAVSDAVLITSRGGTHYDRTFLESFVRAGMDPRDWVARSNYPARGVVPTGKNEMSMYVQRHYGQPSAYLERMVLRIDGFASVHAPYRGGEMITKPFRFSGKVLVINFATSAAGGVRVEVQDEHGDAVEGFSLDDCPLILGDNLEHVVKWKGGGDVSALAGRPVRLRFVMRDADLYSLRFR